MYNGISSCLILWGCANDDISSATEHLTPKGLRANLYLLPKCKIKHSQSALESYGPYIEQPRFYYSVLINVSQ